MTKLFKKESLKLGHVQNDIYKDIRKAEKNYFFAVATGWLVLALLVYLIAY